MNVRAHVFVEGRVQGVSFRWATLTEARDKQVNVWVRNLPDGRVEAIFEGEQKTVEEMIDFCRRGPPGSRVTWLQVIWEKQLKNYKIFEIRS